MAVCPEKVKNKITGQYEEKKVNGKIQYCIRTYVIGEDGKRHQTTKHNPEWLGQNGYWQAHAVENHLREKKPNKYENMTLLELENNFLEYKKGMIKLSTYLKYKSDIENYILPYFDKKIIDITPKDILDWQCKLNKLSLSIYTKKRTYTTFSSIIKFSCRTYGFEKNVVSMVDNFKAPKGINCKKINYLTEQEFNQFIIYEHNKEYHDFFTILFYTGMRRGELLALSKNDIDFDKNTITINKTYSPKYQKYGIEETEPKTNSSNRNIKMLNIVKKTLQNMKLNDNGRIFNNITLTTLKRKCDNNLKHADIDKNIRIHDFRHSFASMCINNDVPISIISEYLGHENITITLNTYSHLYPDAQDKLLLKLNHQD